MSGCIFLYFYKRSEHHGARETDEMILSSLSSLGIAGEVKRSELGKPYIVHGADCMGEIFVSVSHTDGIVAVALSPCSIGIDIEKEDRRVRDIDSTVSRFFTSCEAEKILSLDGDGKRRAFLLTWVKKEAMVKENGKGISGIREADSTAVSGEFLPFAYRGHVGAVYSASVGMQLKIRREIAD